MLVAVLVADSEMIARVLMSELEAINDIAYVNYWINH